MLHITYLLGQGFQIIQFLVSTLNHLKSTVLLCENFSIISYHPGECI